jgi:GTP-binding protein
MAPLVAIIGRPNVGKSTLFNRLTRTSNALVDDRPGITRDRIYATVTIDDVPLTLIDTGGFDDAGHDPLTVKVKDQVEMALDEADAIVLVVDGRQGLMPGDELLYDRLRRRGKKVVVAANKVDGPELDHLVTDFLKLGAGEIHPVSAAHGYGVKSLMSHLLGKLPVGTPSEEEEPSCVRIAILGKPNVGKSSLINRIVGKERLLVSELPGTTRDAVDVAFEWRGKPYLLIDTAGIRRKGKVTEKIEKFSVIKALRSLRRCDVAVVVLDASVGVTEQDVRICGYAFEETKPVLIALNKWDLVKGDPGKKRALEAEIDRLLHFIAYAPKTYLSALTGERVTSLFQKADALVGQYARRVQTSDVNKAIQETIEQHPPPRVGRGQLKFLYATQAQTRPPVFVVFVNRPEWVHFSYKRFITNRLKASFRLDLIPIKVVFKKR